MFVDPLHHDSGPDTAWSRVNTAEALPGVLTPLGWTFWMEPLELAMRGAFADIGVLRPSEIRVAPSVDDRYSAIFYGRFSGNIDEMRRMADQMPGTSGDALELQLFGALRPGVTSRRSFRRYPVVAARMPKAALSVPKTLARLRTDTDSWWRACTSPGLSTDVAGARARFAEAMKRFEAIMRPHSVVTMLGQALGDQVHKLAESAGRPDLEPTLMTGFGGMEETQLMADLWAVSRGRQTLDAFLAAHGYHGPSEGELSTRSWREDPTPVEALLGSYRAMDDGADPRSLETLRGKERHRRPPSCSARCPRCARAEPKSCSARPSATCPCGRWARPPSSRPSTWAGRRPAPGRGPGPGRPPGGPRGRLLPHQRRAPRRPAAGDQAAGAARRAPARGVPRSGSPTCGPACPTRSP